jgi:hypothetical protein
LPVVGGGWTADVSAGTFYILCSYSSSFSRTDFVTSLSY